MSKIEPLIKDLSKNDKSKEPKGKIPKNMKKKHIKVKNKENEGNNLNKNQNKNKDKKDKINEQYKNNGDIIQEKDINKSETVKSDDIRYFGKKIDNISSLDERINQYIIKGNTFKKYFNSNSFIVNQNINYENDNNEIFEFLNIKYLNDPQYVIQYRNDIFLNLLKEENNSMPNYCKLSEIIPEETRNKYLLFLISVCDKITKKEEIHYLSINIFDRVITKLFDNKNIFTEKKLQLICFTSLFVAYKYETGYYFLIEDLIRHTEDSLVTKEEVLNFEYEINNILNFEYLIVYPSHFLKHYELIDNINNKKIYFFCLYLLDFILSDLKLMNHKKSLISASCYYIAKANLLNIKIWPNVFQFMTGYNKNEIKDFSIKIIKTMKNTKNSSIFKCLKKKYSKNEYYNVVDSIIGKK
jgi:hypothetical protein